MEIHKKQTLSETFSVYFEKRMARILLLGIISGFPWVLIGSSLSLWLKEDGLSRSTIGWAGLIFAVYAFNYLWAPIVDRIRIPWLTNKIGHRRGWIVTMQIIILICLYAIYRWAVAWIEYYSSLDQRLGLSIWRYSYDYHVVGKRDLTISDDKNLVILRRKRNRAVTFMYFIFFLSFVFFMSFMNQLILRILNF